jgi:hypothetical protein
MKRRPEVETLPLTGDGRAVIVKDVLSWLMQGMN